jgi:hypothetical protein
MSRMIEYRQQAKECLELASRPNELYLVPLLLELAAEYNEAAEELERGEPFTTNMLRRTTSTEPAKSRTSLSSYRSMAALAGLRTLIEHLARPGSRGAHSPGALAGRPSRGCRLKRCLQ